jgi:glycosyltransferase involved in cell wall biosynthesis
MKPRISLIIPAYNEERYIGKCLESVEKAKRFYGKPSLIETIVVDNGSTDRTAMVARQYDTKIIFEGKRQIAMARNKGASVARGDLVGFLDADCIITPNMFVLIDETMASGKYIGGGTEIKVDRNSLGIFCTLCITKYPFIWLLGISGGLLFTEKSTFDEIGGFDTSLYSAEDAKFALVLKKHGKKRGKKFKVLIDAYVVTSARSFDMFGDWYYFRNLPRFMKNPRKATRGREFSDKFWYDVDR